MSFTTAYTLDIARLQIWSTRFHKRTAAHEGYATCLSLGRFVRRAPISYCEAAGARAKVVPYEEPDVPDTITCVKDDQQEVTSVPDTAAPPTLRTRTSRYGIDSLISELRDIGSALSSDPPRWPLEKSLRMGSMPFILTYADGASNAMRRSLSLTVCMMAKSRA